MQLSYNYIIIFISFYYIITSGKSMFVTELLLFIVSQLEKIILFYNIIFKIFK